jgi:exodeoxyribonuclease VII small subunit
MMAKADSSKRRRAAKTDEDSVDFETSLEKAEEILTRLESGELGLTESLEQYETGIRQLKRCHSLLDGAEQRVSMLSGFDADGNPISESLDPANVATQRRTAGDGDTGNDEADGDSVDDVPGLF